MKKTFALTTLVAILYTVTAFAHCQMPCGIYHDDMVYDQLDQYVETMFKGVTMLSNSKFASAWDRNEFVRWVMQKEKASDEAAQLFTTYFLQQKIKPGEDDTVKRLTSVHKLLFLLVQIKQNTERKLVEEFADEWEKFKLMFHVEGYVCQIEMLKKRKREQLEQKLNGKEASTAKPAPNHNHYHNHDDDHDHDHDHDDDHDHDHDDN